MEVGLKGHSFGSEVVGGGGGAASHFFRIAYGMLRRIEMSFESL